MKNKEPGFYKDEALVVVKLEDTNTRMSVRRLY